MDKRLFSTVMILFCLFITDSLRAQDQHWQCDPYAFEYDMTAYVTLSENENAISELTNYEIAAFCDEECRGVSKLMTADEGAKYFYLRIRSNVASGEQIKFCVYDAVTDKEIWAEESVTFESQSVVGLPSAPMILNIIQKGDVNGDGTVDIADAVCIVNHIVGKSTPVFIEEAADVNSDGDIDIADAVRIVNLIVGKINALARQRGSMELEPE